MVPIVISNAGVVEFPVIVSKQASFGCESHWLNDYYIEFSHTTKRISAYKIYIDMLTNSKSLIFLANVSECGIITFHTGLY